MTSALYASRNVERGLIEQQRSARNLTTFRVYPFPSTLHEIPYPLDFKGSRMAPDLLLTHSKTHDFDMPQCFHGSESRPISTNSKGISLICGAEGDEPCGFFIDLNKLLYSGFKVKCARYCLRLAGSPFSSDGASSDSLPSLISVSDSDDNWSDGSPLSDFLVDDRDDIVDDNASYIPSSMGSSSDMSIGESIFDVSASRGRGRPSRGGAGRRSFGRVPVLSSSSSDVSLLESGSPMDTDCSREGGDGRLGGHEASVVDVVDGWACFGGRSSEPRQVSNVLRETSLAYGQYPRQRSVSMKATAPKGLYDEDVYPLLARPDGVSSLISCVDPATEDFSNEMFISQIIKDSHKREIWY